MKETVNSYILGYARDLDYEKERKRKRGKKPRSEGMNTLYKCNSCGKVWETYLNHRKQFVSYTDIPTYGLKNNKCKLCKGECNG
tara:strand:+ start:394 stop:645 length:252 start_codon:yes stop_codon:yes gene_type:complete